MIHLILNKLLRFKKIPLAAYALVGYTALTLVLTYPVAAEISTSVPWGSQDTWHGIWNIWRIKHSLMTGSSLWYTNMVLYPTGVDLTFQVQTLFNSLLSIPLQLAFGLIPAYNILFLFSYVMSGFAMYLLADYLIGDKLAAFVAGIIYAYAPIHVHQSLVHLNIMSIEWMPLYALFMIKMFREDEMRNAVYASIFLLINSLTDLYFLVYAFVFTVLYFLYSVLTERASVTNVKFWKRSAVMAILFLVPFTLIHYPLICSTLFASYSFASTSLRGQIRNSADLAAFFVPSPLHPLFKDFSTPIFSRLGSGPGIHVYIGYTVLFMAPFAVSRLRKKVVGFWLLSSTLFLVLSLGAYLRFFRQTIVAMPYLWLYYYVPLLKNFRSTGRFNILTMLSLAVLVGFSLKTLSERLKGGRIFKRMDRFKLLYVVVAALVIFEFIPTPLPTLNADIPKIYRMIAEDEGNFAIIEVPITDSLDVYMYYHTYHQKPIVNGHVSRTPRWACIFMESAPFVSQLYAKPRRREDILSQTVDHAEIAPYILGEYDIKYIIVHKRRDTYVQYVHDPRLGFSPSPWKYFQRVIGLLNEVFDNPHYEDRYIIAYKFDDYESYDLMAYLRERKLPFIMLLKGDWYPLRVSHPGTPTRYMAQSASVELTSNGINHFQLRFKAFSFHRPRVLQVLANSEMVGSYLIPSGQETVVTTPVLRAWEGTNVITFYTPDGCEPLSADNPEAVSVAFQGIEVLPSAPSSVQYKASNP